MKTIFKNGAYERVSEEVAEISVRHQGARYVSKAEWKQATRSVKSETVEVAEVKGQETKSKKAEKAAKLKAKQRQ
jgi:hypothetical protein